MAPCACQLHSTPSCEFNSLHSTCRRCRRARWSRRCDLVTRPWLCARVSAALRRSPNKPLTANGVEVRLRVLLQAGALLLHSERDVSRLDRELDDCCAARLRGRRRRLGAPPRHRATHVRYLDSCSWKSWSTVFSTCPVFCMSCVPARDAAFLNLLNKC